MSPQTQSILSHIDYEIVIQQRRQNYHFLSETLGEMNLLQLPPMDSFACPMVYPFMANDESLRIRLIENKVFVARYWTNVLEWYSKDDIEYKLATRIIPLPIDQRYGEKNMQIMINLITKYNK
jgi:hypothetical protein